VDGSIKPKFHLLRHVTTRHAQRVVHVALVLTILSRAPWQACRACRACRAVLVPTWRTTKNSTDRV